MVGHDPDLEQDVHEIEFLLRQVALAVKKRGREILGRFEITPPQFDALLVVSRQPGLTMGELCNRLYLASSTVTDLVDRMEKAGLVVRERDPHDRRVVRLQPTPRGQGLIQEVLRARREYLAGILEQVDREERRQLVAALGHLHRLMSDHGSAS